MVWLDYPVVVMAALPLGTAASPFRWGGSLSQMGSTGFDGYEG